MFWQEGYICDSSRLSHQLRPLRVLQRSNVERVQPLLLFLVPNLTQRNEPSSDTINIGSSGLAETSECWITEFRLYSMF